MDEIGELSPLAQALFSQFLGMGDVLSTLALEVRVILEHDHTRVPERAFKCSMRLAVRGPYLYAEDVEVDLYAAIDLVAKKLEQQIRKRRNKIKARKHNDASQLKRKRQESGV